MKRVLFVDDETRVLEGLRHRLRKQRQCWDMHFVSSGADALTLLAGRHFDVVVSDMRMPNMDGATLLQEVQKFYPHIVRIVLSGYAESETAMRVVPVAHQFLSKPCDAGVLENIVDRACLLQEFTNNEGVRSIVGGINKLPSSPQVYSKLLQVMQSENVSTPVVASILKQDIAMCAKILQLVNSAFFRLSRQITTIDQAVTYLGFDSVKQLVLAVEVFGANPSRYSKAISLSSMQNHAILTGNIAVDLFDNKQIKGDAYIAGVLHDIGKLILAKEIPVHLERALQAVGPELPSLFLAEKKLYNITHAEIGAYLLGLWGLPYHIVEAVANHHQPSRVQSESFGLHDAVHIASVLANEYIPPFYAPKRRCDDKLLSLDYDRIEALGLTERIPSWRSAAQARVGTSRLP